ncbi:TonB-dependent receptor plug [Capnocytophaga ochracea DSM 7271]|uniref:TonB-dependent receptor plug n=1 Tax=Capnocytophaga ochracea (strain ATCC 27872 / DSM 7271 / CCUG 9716 / JCM 12966 / NCTC 12371 / SS31 / VPI 2845) TaxID=521097 RepID=C7M474_CAPOD|nr:SusC/RagA family TonB-linked outer membrane protein [Capnocytophaga ochracea]ACU92629.1 TonB-dependent receptor plug [Capnocytophaga ochracea DSM 7271]UAK51354.1 SusC/RagA family TonB-linked outer membrane protein [Capnocytophaga ochracea]
MKEKLMYALLCTVLFFGVAFAQERTVTGVVKDEAGTPLPGASVLVKGTSHGVATDFDGKYSIKVPNDSAVLVFSQLGSASVEKVVGTAKVINVVLKENVTELKGVVVTGYQEFDRSKFTGNAQTLKADNIKMDGVVDVGRMIEGRAAGVNVQNISGTFGTSPKITIRGGSSIFGDTKPLWVVDGAVQEEVVNLSFEQLASGDASTLVSSAISGINANDIESIEILKDASALSLYGARALNGAVIITTKSGKKNVKTQINYQLEESVRMIPNYNQYDIMNSQETMDVYQELERKGYFSLSSHTQARYGGAYNIMYRAIDTFNPATGTFLLENTDAARVAFLRKYEYANTNWFKTLFRPSLTQNHTVSLSGGGENATVYGSVGFFVDPGWTIADRIHRVTGNLKTTYTLSPSVKIGVLTQGSIRTQKAPGTYSRAANAVTGSYERDFDINPFSYALNTTRALRPYGDDGKYEFYRYNYAPMNILHELANNYMDLNVLEYKIQGDLEVKLAKGLKYNFLGSVRHVKSSNEHSMREDSNVAGAYRANQTTVVTKANPFLFTDPADPDALPQVALPNGGIYKRTENNLQSYYFRNALEYKRLFKDVHDLKVFLGQEYRHTDRDNSFFNGYGYQFARGGTAFTDYRIIQKAIQENTPYFGKSYTKERGIAFFLQGTYTYDNRYVFAGTLNYEGSNQLGRSRSARWLPTWNASARWNASNEKFLEDNNTISNLAFRLSYGLIAGLGAASNALAIFKNEVANRYNLSDRESMITIQSLQNSELTWEKVYETNVGIELGLFKNRINLSLDLYQKNSKDLIDYVRTSGIGGEIIKLANNATMVTKGIELALDTKNVKTDDFSWNTGINFAYFNQEITSLLYKPNVFNLVREVGGNVVGGARNTLYSYDFRGLNDKGLPVFNLRNGSTDYADIDFQNRQDILSYLKKEGAVEPNLTAGLSNTFKYKNWEFSFLITASAGNKIRKADQYTVDYNDLSVFPKEMKNRWVRTGDEKITNIPSIPSKFTLNEVGEDTLRRVYNAYNHSTARVVDGSFIRMKSMSLSYTFAKDVLDALHVNNLTLRLQATNPFLIYAHKDLNGQDPEFFRTGGVAYPVSAQYTFTINLGI